VPESAANSTDVPTEADGASTVDVTSGRVRFEGAERVGGPFERAVESEQLEMDALPTMRDLDGLRAELDDIDRVLLELDQNRPGSEPLAGSVPEPS
jgi:hypothetical protein